MSNQNWKIAEGDKTISFSMRLHKDENPKAVNLFFVPQRINEPMVFADEFIFYNNDWSECGSIFVRLEQYGGQQEIIFGIELNHFSKQYETAYVLLNNEDHQFSQAHHDFIYSLNNGESRIQTLNPGDILSKGHHLMGVLQRNGDGWTLTPCLHRQSTVLPDVLETLEMNERVNMAWSRAQLGFAGLSRVTPELRADQLPWMNEEELRDFFDCEYTPSFAQRYGQLTLDSFLTRRSSLTVLEQGLIRQLVADGAQWWSLFTSHTGLRMDMPTDKLKIIETLIDAPKKINDWRRPILETFSDEALLAFCAISQAHADKLYRLWPRDDFTAYASPRARKERLNEDLGL